MAKIKYLAIDQSDCPQGILYAHSRVSAQAYLDTKKLPYTAVKAEKVLWCDGIRDLPLLLGTPRSTPGKYSTGYSRNVALSGLSARENRFLSSLAKKHRLSGFLVGLVRSYLENNGD